MNKFFAKIGLVAGALLLAMCTNNTDSDEINISVTPEADNVASLYAGEKSLYEVKIESPSTFRLKITTFEQQNGLNTMVDTMFNSSIANFSYVFTAPELLREKCEVRITFTATDAEGNEATTIRKANVHSRGISLEEITGIVLYSPESGRPDALSLNDVSRPFILAESPRPDTADVYLASNPDFSNITMCSNTDTKFIRMNTFNYSSATAAAVVSAYDNSVHADIVNNVQVNDIIVVGREGSARGVFFVSNILRGGEAIDCIQLNYKEVKSTK